MIRLRPILPASCAFVAAITLSATAADRAPLTDFQLDGNRLVLPSPIVFAANGDDLDETASAAALWTIHDYLASHESVTLLRLEGHGSQPGRDAMMQTGEQALGVGHWLVAHGIDCQRLVAAAFGDTKPLVDPSTPEGRAANVRIEAINAQLRGHAIGGLPADGGAAASVAVCD